MNTADALLAGGIDMHCHGYPEFSLEFPNRFSEEDTVRMMRDAGMGGVVMKSHFWPTISSASYLNKLYPDFDVFSSITLNASAGGVTLWAVEAAAKQGAKVVYLPTWSARNDQKLKTQSGLMQKYLPKLATFPMKDAFQAVDGKGRVLPAVLELIEYLKEQDMVLFTGHISPSESLAIAKAAKELGFEKLVMNHPDSGSVRADFDQVVAMAELGAHIELCALGLSPIYYRTTPQEFKEIIHRIGAEKCILTTDYFFEWSSSVPEQMRLLVSCLLHAGVGEDEVALMLRETPRYLLGLNDKPASSIAHA